MVVILKNGFVKELKKLPPHTQALVHQVLKTLRDSKTLESSNLDLTRMEGQKKSESYYRVRVGQWRIGIEYDHPDVIVITILSRGNIYKHFPPK
jgi:mRNA interferase RelE/StbE